MKLRVNATPAERARMAALGATAVPMGLPEMITSLQNGVIDGTMSGISIYVNFNLQNVGKTLTETNDTLLVSFGALSKAWLDKLPPDLRKIVVDEARKLQPGRCKQSDDEKAELREKWIERGGEIVTLPAEDQAELQKRLKPIGARSHQGRSDAQGVLRQDQGDRGEILSRIAATGEPFAARRALTSRSRSGSRPDEPGAPKDRSEDAHERTSRARDRGPSGSKSSCSSRSRMSSPASCSSSRRPSISST